VTDGVVSHLNPEQSCGCGSAGDYLTRMFWGANNRLGLDAETRNRAWRWDQATRGNPQDQGTMRQWIWFRSTWHS